MLDSVKGWIHALYERLFKLELTLGYLLFSFSSFPFYTSVVSVLFKYDYSIYSYFEIAIIYNFNLKFLANL